MRRYRQDQPPPHMFRGAELARLMTGVVMLAVLYMLIARARDTDTWRWLANDDGKALATAKQPAPPPPPLPSATGPTDEDHDQAKAAREEFQALTDGSLTLGPEEMEPYYRLVEWVKNQSFTRLRGRARTDLLFTNFHDEPDKYRGQPVTLEMTVRRILDAGKSRDDGVQLYEVWGFTAESLDRLYVAIVVDLPKGMPIGPSIYEKARLVGYFFKLQGYHSAGTRPGAVPDRAPLLIGRLQWEPMAAPPVDNTWEWTLGLATLAIIALVLGFRLVYSKWIRKKPAIRSMVPDAASGEVIPIEAWLERAGFPGDDGKSQVEEKADFPLFPDRVDDQASEDQ